MRAASPHSRSRDILSLRADHLALDRATSEGKTTTRSSSTASDAASTLPPTPNASSPCHSLCGTAAVSDDAGICVKMPPATSFRRRVYLVRHAESVVNATSAPTQAVFDPALSLTGKQQAAHLGAAADVLCPDLILTSTLRRALDTSSIGFDGYINDTTLDFVPVFALDELREVVGCMQVAELRRPVSVLGELYPSFSFEAITSGIDPMMHLALNMTTREGGPGERSCSLTDRAIHVARLLTHDLPPTCRSIVVVSHYHLLQRLVDILARPPFSSSSLENGVRSSSLRISRDELDGWANTGIVSVDMDVQVHGPDIKIGPEMEVETPPSVDRCLVAWHRRTQTCDGAEAVTAAVVGIAQWH